MCIEKYAGVGRRGLLGFILIVRLSAQSVDPESLLASVRSRISSAIKRAPQYACTDAIQRHWYRDTLPFTPRNVCAPQEAIKYTLFKQDRLRLDVSVIGGRETYSWPGAVPFETSCVDTLVKEGPITSGTFFGFLFDLFVTANAQYTFAGVNDVNGRAADIYRFTVAAPASHFVPAVHGGLVLGYSGLFAADARTGELLSLDVTTAESGPDALFCNARLKAYYSNPQPELLLPASVSVDITEQGRRPHPIIDQLQRLPAVRWLFRHPFWRHVPRTRGAAAH